MPKPALNEIPTPPELNDLQAALAQADVVAEMSNPAGLRLDEAVTDPVSQYRHDVRLVLAGYPQDLDTALAAKAVVLEEFAVPEAQTAVPVPVPPPPPVLVSIAPTSGVALDGAQLTLTATGTGFLPEDVIVFAGASQETTVVSETEATCVIPPGAAAGDVSVLVSAVAGPSNPLTFTYTEPVVPPEAPPPEEEGRVTPAPAPEPAAAAAGPVIEGA